MRSLCLGLRGDAPRFFPKIFEPKPEVLIIAILFGEGAEMSLALEVFYDFIGDPFVRLERLIPAGGGNDAHAGGPRGGTGAPDISFVCYQLATMNARSDLAGRRHHDVLDKLDGRK